MLKTLALSTAALAVVSCGSPDRPPPSDSIVIHQSAFAGTTGTPTEPGPPPRVCEPRSSRECTVTYRDLNGQIHCPEQLQICSLEGTEWLACGMFVYDENHDPQPHP